MRDVTFGENRSAARGEHDPQVMTTLWNVAVRLRRAEHSNIARPVDGDWPLSRGRHELERARNCEVTTPEVNNCDTLTNFHSVRGSKTGK